MSEQKQRTERLACWGACESCAATVVVYPHWEATDKQRRRINNQSKWERGAMTDCPCCDDGQIDWGGSDPVEQIVRNA